MSQQKAQLISPIDTFTPPGINVTGAGIVTATSFVGSGGTVTDLAAGANVTAGVVTATSFYGDGSNLDGVAAAGYVGQTIAAQSGTTTIDLSAGNVIYFTQDTDTTVAFASTEAVQEVLFIRTKDDTTTARTITWPSSIIWNGGTAPTLIDSSDGNDVQIFNLTTRDQGVTWYGYEAMKNDPAEPNYLFGWGYNANGAIGLNDVAPRSSPTQIPGDQWVEVTTANSSTLARKSDGTLFAWGHHRVSSSANEVYHSSPVQIPGTQWSAISTHDTTALALKTDGTLWAWGRGSQGQIGANDTNTYSSPKQIPGTQWSTLGRSGGENLAVGCIKTDGTLWLWGYNLRGQLGQNNNIYYSSPRQVPGSSWSNFAQQNLGTLATKTDGTLWGWGQDYYGNLGQNQYSNAYWSSPRQIPGTAWDTVAAGFRTGIATKTDGTLWTWGRNDNGILGLNDGAPRSSPTQVPGTQWLNPYGGYEAMMCFKTDGTLWTWGHNNHGQQGQNNQGVPRSSPMQIPGSWHTTTGDTGKYGVFATKPTT